MRERWLYGVGAGALVGAAVWAAFGGRPASVWSLAAIGMVLALVDVGVWGAEERAGHGLQVPRGKRLPWPAWEALVSVIAALAVLLGLVTGASELLRVIVDGGSWVDRVLDGAAIFVAVGVILLLAAAVGLAARTRRDRDTTLERSVARQARALLRSYGPRARGYVTPAGRDAVRIVVAGDRSFGDVVVRGSQRAELVAELAGLSLVEPTDPAFRLPTGRSDWAFMASPR